MISWAGVDWFGDGGGEAVVQLVSGENAVASGGRLDGAWREKMGEEGQCVDPLRFAVSCEQFFINGLCPAWRRCQRWSGLGPI